MVRAIVRPFPAHIAGTPAAIGELLPIAEQEITSDTSYRCFLTPLAEAIASRMEWHADLGARYRNRLAPEVDAMKWS